MRASKKQQPKKALAYVLLCSTSLVFPSQAVADDVIIDLNLPGFDPTRTNGAIGFPINPGDTVTVTEATLIDITDAAGVDVFRADGVVVTNNGAIFTSGTEAGANILDPNSFGYGDGVFVFESDNATIINNGTVAVGDFFANGLYHWQGADSMTFNNGVILILEEILEPDPDGRINPDTGLPFLTAGASAGVRIDAYENREDENLPSVGLRNHYVENNGTIASFAVQSRGLFIDGANFWTIDDDNDPSTPDVTDDAFFSVDAIAVNNGQILMRAETPSSGIFDASGMRAEAHDAVLVNNGYIEVRPEGFGIDYNGANGTVLNYGTILTFNEDSHGIEHYRNGTTTPTDLRQSFTANMGFISVQGANNHGVSLTGHVGHLFENAGTVFSRDGYAIESGDGNLRLQAADMNEIRLLDGSLLFGDVFVDAQVAAFTSLSFGDGLNAVVRFEDGAHMGNGRPSDLPLIVTSAHNSHVFDAATNAYYVADLDGYLQQDQAFFDGLVMAQNAVDGGMAGAAPSNALRFINEERDTWFRAFGGAAYTPSDGAMPAYRRSSFGALSGVNASPLGFFGGAMYSTATGDETVSYDTDALTVLAGLSRRVGVGTYLSLMGGLTWNSTDREVADNRVVGGIDRASADYLSAFLSPSVRFNGPFDGSSIRLRYTGLWTEGHSFRFSQGTTLEVEDRFSNSVDARFEMQQPFEDGHLAYGVDAIWTDGNAVDFTLAGQPGLSTPYDTNVSGRLFARYTTDGWSLEGSVDSEGRASIGFGITF